MEYDVDYYLKWMCKLAAVGVFIMLCCWAIVAIVDQIEHPAPPQPSNRMCMQWYPAGTNVDDLCVWYATPTPEGK